MIVGKPHLGRYEPGTRVIIADLSTREMDLIPWGFPYG
jgi:hypothetical protein